jgi:hypothetical protein
MYCTVKYLPLGVKNVQTGEFYFCLTDLADYGKVELAAKTLGVLISDIKSVEES